MSQEKKFISTGKFLYLLLVPVLLISGAVMYYFYNKCIEESEFNVDAYQLYTGEEMIKEAKRYGCDYKFELVKDTNFRWIVPGDRDINVSSSGIQVTVDNCKDDDGYVQFLSSVIDKINYVMDMSGFGENNLNVEGYSNEYHIPVLGAYEKDDNIKCLLIKPLNTETNGISLNCTQDFQEDYNSQIVYLEDLDIKEKYITWTDEYISEDWENDIVYITLSDRNSFGGYTILAKKIDEKWVNIWQGQDMPSCDFFDEYNLPVGYFFYGECTEE